MGAVGCGVKVGESTSSTSEGVRLCVGAVGFPVVVGCGVRDGAWLCVGAVGWGVNVGASVPLISEGDKLCVGAVGFPVLVG